MMEPIESSNVVWHFCIVTKMDFVHIDFENSSIIGETYYGTMLLLETKGISNGQMI